MAWSPPEVTAESVSDSWTPPEVRDWTPPEVDSSQPTFEQSQFVPPPDQSKVSSLDPNTEFAQYATTPTDERAAGWQRLAIQHPELGTIEPAGKSIATDYAKLSITPIIQFGDVLGLDPKTVADAWDVVKAVGSSPMGRGLQEELAKPSRPPTVLESTIAGSQRAVIDSLDFFTSPVGAMTLGTGAAPVGVQRAVGLAFAVQMSQQAPEQLQQFLEAKYAGDTEGMARGLTGMGLTGAFVVAGAKEAVKGIIPNEVPKIETPAEAQARSQLINELNKVAPMTAQAVKEVEPNARSITSAEGVSGAQVRTGVDEATSLRQQGEAANARPSGEIVQAAPVSPKEEITSPETKPSETTLVAPEGGTPSAEVGPGLEGSVGAAAAGSEEFVRGTALKNIVGALERQQAGLPEPYKKIKRPIQQTAGEAADILGKDPQAGKKIADELALNPERGMTDVDSALLLFHKEHLIESRNQAASDTITAKTPEAKAEAQQRFDTLSNELLDLLDAAKFRGSQWGREGIWRQVLKAEDFSLERMLSDTQESLGRKLDATKPEDSAIIKQIEEQSKRIAELEKQLAEKEKANVETQRANVMEEAVEETGKTARADVMADETKGVERDLPAEETAAIEHLKDRFIEQGNLLGANPAIKKLMELLWQRGIRERIPMEDAIHKILKEKVDPTIEIEDVQDLMSGYGKYKEPSKDQIKAGVAEVRGQILQVRKMLDIVRQGYAKPTGFLRQVAGQVQRNLIKAVNEIKKQYGVPQDAAKALQSALDSVNTRLKNRLMDLKQEVATRQKIIKERKPSPYNDETLRLKKEIEEVQKQWDEIFPKEPLTPEQRLKIAEASAQRQIVELERQLKTGEIFPKGKDTSPTLRSEMLDAAKARIEALKAERDSLRESVQPTPEPEAIQLSQILARLRKREADYLDRIARGDFAAKVKKELPSSPEVLAARVKTEQAKTEFLKARHLDRLARQSTGQKIWRGIKQARGAIVNIVSSFDFSAPRQALTAILANSTRLVTHPLIGARMMAFPFRDMFQAWASEHTARIIEQRLKDRPNAKSGADKLAGIEFSELETNKFTRHEENAHSILDEWAALPMDTGNTSKTLATAPIKLAARGVRMSNRAFVTFLNSTRAELFDFLTETRFKDRAPTKNELQIIGNLVNVTTGRGKLSPLTAQVSSEVMWAPKLLTSRLQLLTGQPLWTGEWAKSGRARRIVAEEYARIIIGGFLLQQVSSLFDEKKETNPTSSDFGKVVRGSSRIDLWGGLQQVTVLGARTITATTKSIKGKEAAIGADRKYGQRGIWYVWSDFGRSKLRPDIATAVDVITRANLIGEPTTPASAAQSVLVPLPMRDIVQIMKSRGFTEGMIDEMLGQFGAGVSNYEQKERQR